MSSVSLPCPSCSAPLILDEENAGQEVICPGCAAHLKLPPTVSTKSPPVVVSSTSAPVPANPAASGETSAKSALPRSRSKSVEDERKRLAAAAAAAGGAHSFKPEEAALPADRRPAVLPFKRALPASEETPDTPAPSGAEPLSKPHIALPVRRTAGSPLEPRSAAVPLQPMEPREDVEISVTPLTGPSRFVNPTQPAADLPAAPRTAPESSTEGPASVSAEKEPREPTARGGFRLGGSRQLHFSPAQATETDGEAATWGTKVETAEQAAKGRRFVSLAIGIALLAAIGVGSYVLREAFAKDQQTAQPSDDGPVAAPKAAEDVMRNVEDAKRVLKRFLAADSVEKMAAEVRHPDVTLPRMERFYAATPLKPRKIVTESQSWSELRIENTEFIRSGLELDDFRVHAVTLELIPGAEPKVDWESYVSWAELPWKDFLRTPPERSMDYRVTVTLDPADQYYNYSFKGRELDLLCFKLEDPEKYGSCWAYCDKDSEAAGQLLFNLKRSRQQGIVNDQGKTAIGCILRLRFPPEGMKTNQVMIEKFLGDNWVQP